MWPRAFLGMWLEHVQSYLLGSPQQLPWLLELSVYHPTSTQDQLSQAHLGPSQGGCSSAVEMQGCRC